MTTEQFKKKHGQEIFSVINTAFNLLGTSADDVALEDWYNSVDYIITNTSKTEEEAILNTITGLLNHNCIEEKSDVWNFAEQLIKAIKSRPLGKDVMPNEVLGGGLNEKVARYLVDTFWAGLLSHPKDSSLRDMTKEQYYELNKLDWQAKATCVITCITNESRREV